MTAMTKHNTGDVPQPTGNWPLDGCACQKSGGNGGNGESGYSLNCAVFLKIAQFRLSPVYQKNRAVQADTFPTFPDLSQRNAARK
jgi:hypothetical protein